MRIRSTGNVGIGTNAPSNLLSINSGGVNTAALSLTTSGSGWGSGIQFVNSTASTGRTYGVYSGSEGSLHVTDVTGNVDRLTITSSGAVTVGSVLSFTVTITVGSIGYAQIIANSIIGNPLYVTSGVWLIVVNATTITNPNNGAVFSAKAYAASNTVISPTYVSVYDAVSNSSYVTLVGGANGGGSGLGIFLNVTNTAAYGTYVANFLRLA